MPWADGTSITRNNAGFSAQRELPIRHIRMAAMVQPQALRIQEPVHMGVASTKEAQHGPRSERADVPANNTSAYASQANVTTKPHAGVQTVVQSGERSRPIALITRSVVGCVVLGAAMAAAQMLVATKPPPEKKPVEESTYSVVAIEAPQFVVAQRFDGYGTVRAMADSDVTAEVKGVVIDRPVRVEEGSAIAQGQRIVLLDASDYQQQLLGAQQRVASLEAQIESLDIQQESLKKQIELTSEQTELARNDYNRELEAREQGAHNDIDVEQTLSSLIRHQRDLEILKVQLAGIEPSRKSLQAQVNSAKADVALAQKNVDRTEISAPIGGTLQMVNARVGEQLMPGTLVARIVDLSRVEVPVRLPMSARNLVHPGDAIEIVTGAWVGAFVETRWNATIARISPEVDTQTRTIIAYVVVDQDHANGAGVSDKPVLLPGQFVETTVVSSSSQQRVVIPRTSVDNDHVFVADEKGQVSRRSVRIAFTVDAKELPSLLENIPETEHHITQWAVLDSGVEPGERVILSNLSQMVPGTYVNTSIGGEIHFAEHPQVPAEPTDESTAGGAS
ncbi:MAG: HlyD family efflux transporter periplasmic adaptor subunit [Phycisphaeraceae bacterium]|nr:HlyD family efflux transporter periplasmic adaptor subunit [Phycisphaeraceae bacterium]